jgi:3-methyl-2-oxobutanoate hydroxymethyltransferase
MSTHRKPVTAPVVSKRKTRDGGDPLVMITAYDYHSARLADEAGVDLILVGDSLGMVVQGRPDTLPVTIDDIVYHCRAVTRAQPKALVVADLPWLSYHVSSEDTIRNAGRCLREGRAGCVKLEGGEKRLPAVRAILDAEIPVMGHLGLTPQSVNALGGFKVQGKNEEAATRLVEDALRLQDAGVFGLVLECVPSDVAQRVTEALEIPTIGIGAGRGTDGQVLVWHDLLGITPDPLPRFVRRYEDFGVKAKAAIERYAADVKDGSFPDDTESYSYPRPAEAKGA